MATTYPYIYIGLCINNNDPEKRGRVQVFIPHIMPALYEGWNKEGNDINISCVGDNIAEGLTSEQIIKLRNILPWAEAASPICGTSAPGNLVSRVENAIVGAATAVGNAIAGVFGYDQSPVSEPVSVNPQNQSELFAKAAQFNSSGVTADKFARNTSRDGNCGIGARSILGGLTNNPAFAQGLGGNASTLSTGNNYLQNSGMFNPPVSMPSNYKNDPSQWQVGDTISSTGGGKGQGHVQVWTGKAWVSDFTQANGILNSSHGVPYGDFNLHRMNNKGLAAMGGMADGSSFQIADRTSVSGEQSVANAHQTAESSIDDDPESPTYGNVADPSVENSVAADAAVETATTSGAAGIKPRLTAYSPAQPGSPNYKMEGGYESSKTGPDGTNNVRTLQDVAAGNSKYVTIAGDPSTYGQKYVIPSITFTNAAGQTQTLTNVPAVVHDTGGAFKGAGTSRFDVAVDKGMTNSQMASQDFTSKGLELQPANDAAFNAATAATAAKPTTIVNNTNPHGAVATQNLNNTAKGLFTYPAAGAMLWVFFREGNPLYPVYFAASYSNAEWKSAYGYGSDGPGYRPEGTPDNPVTSTGGIMNLGGVGGIRWEDTNHPTDVTQRQQSMMLFGEDGSNMFMGKGYHQIFSKFDRRDQVEGDRWNTTLGHREDWVQGDHNHVTMGDVFIKIGNVSKPAVDAVTRIQQLIKDGHKPLTDLK